MGSMRAFWEKMRQLFGSFAVNSMQEIYEAIANGHQRPRLAGLLNQSPAAPGSSLNTS